MPIVCKNMSSSSLPFLTQRSRGITFEESCGPRAPRIEQFGKIPVDKLPKDGVKPEKVSAGEPSEKAGGRDRRNGFLNALRIYAILLFGVNHSAKEKTFMS